MVQSASSLLAKSICWLSLDRIRATLRRPGMSACAELGDGTVCPVRRKADLARFQEAGVVGPVQTHRGGNVLGRIPAGPAAARSPRPPMVRAGTQHRRKGIADRTVIKILNSTDSEEVQAACVLREKRGRRMRLSPCSAVPPTPNIMCPSRSGGPPQIRRYS